MKKLPVLLLTLLLVLSLTACGSSSKSAAVGSADCAAEDCAAEESGYWDNAAAAPAAPAGDAKMKDAGDAGYADSSTQPAKMIYTANYEMETTEFEKSADALSALVGSMDGYFENRSVNNYGGGYRYADYTVRIPAEKYSAFCAAAGKQFHIRNFHENADDISEVYYDTRSRLDTANIKLERLQSLLKQAVSMEDIITIENAISDVEYTIESLSGTLKHYDAQVDYATIYIGLSEVYQFSGTVSAPLSFGEKLSDSFRDGFRSVGRFCEGVVMFIAYAWAYLLAAALITVIVIRTVRKRRAKKDLPAKAEE